MNISFGRKIPIIQTQIQNKHTQKFERATVYELDCKDESDILETLKPQNKWTYAREINVNMYTKYSRLQRGDDSKTSFYILQNQQGDTLGMAQTEELEKKGHNLAFLDTEKDKQYKYVGQTLLASITKDIMNKDGIRLSIFEPVPTAVPFYDKICGFQNIGNLLLTADRQEMQDFISKTEQRTQAPLINLKG